MCDPFPITLATDGRTKWRCSTCGRDYETRKEAELTLCREATASKIPIVREISPTATTPSVQTPSQPYAASGRSDIRVDGQMTKEERIQYLSERASILRKDITYLERSSPSGYEIGRKRDALAEVDNELGVLGRVPVTHETSGPESPIGWKGTSMPSEASGPLSGSNVRSRSAGTDNSRWKEPQMKHRRKAPRIPSLGLRRAWAGRSTRQRLWLLDFGTTFVILAYLVAGHVQPTGAGLDAWYVGYLLEAIISIYLLFRLFAYLSRIHTRSRAWFAMLGLAVSFMADVFIIVYLFFFSFTPGNFFSDLSYASAFAPPAIARELPWLSMTFDAVLIPPLILGVGLFFAMDYVGYRFKRHYVIETA